MFNGNQAAEIEQEWGSPRWEGIERPYTAEDVARLRGTVKIEQTLARLGRLYLTRLDSDADGQGFGSIGLAAQ